MKRFLFASLLSATAAFVPHFASAATAVDQYLGRVVIDASSHGEAWYVNPQTRERVSLGRPAEALERFLEHAVPVNYRHIERLAPTPGAAHDSTYAAQVAGQVLLPNDLIGAAWYVDPASGLRRRLATPNDAWAVMLTGAPVSRATLAAIPVEGTLGRRPKMEEVKVRAVLTADTLELADGAKIRLLNVDVPANPDLQEAAMARLRTAIGDGSVTLERDVDDRLNDGRLLRYVHAKGINTSIDLVQKGLAFHAIEQPNFRYAENLIVAGLDAARLKNGFWKK